MYIYNNSNYKRSAKISTVSDVLVVPISLTITVANPVAVLQEVIGLQQLTGNNTFIERRCIHS